jgi:hypothetical protein
MVRSTGSPHGSFEAWRKSRRGSEIDEAVAWRKLYLDAITAEAASAEVLAKIYDGQSKKRSLWKYLADADEKPFTSFAAFCAAAPPRGLGTPVDDLRRLRRVLRFNAEMRAEQAARTKSKP